MERCRPVRVFPIFMIFRFSAVSVGLSSVFHLSLPAEIVVRSRRADAQSGSRVSVQHRLCILLGTPSNAVIREIAHENRRDARRHGRARDLLSWISWRLSETSRCCRSTAAKNPAVKTLNT